MLRVADHEKIRAGRLGHYEANPERLRAYRGANREAILEQKRAYYAANREKIRERGRAYRERMKDDPYYQLRKQLNSMTRIRVRY